MNHYFWAENETRTRDPNLGKVVLYQLSYFRKWQGYIISMFIKGTLPWALVVLSEEEETRTPTGWAHYPLKVARLPFRHLSILVPTTRIELARLSTLAPETSASTIPPRGHFFCCQRIFSLIRERKTRLELATPTLARLCSTNWAISAFASAKVLLFV